MAVFFDVYHKCPGNGPVKYLCKKEYNLHCLTICVRQIRLTS